MNNEAKVINLNARIPSHLQRVPEDQAWEMICEEAIRPTFELLAGNLASKGRPTRIQRVPDGAYYKRPFMLLAWHGEKGLDGIQVALHFTYGGNGLIGFDLSALKTENGTKLQGTYTRRRFNAGDGDLMTNIFHTSSMGMGYAKALEEHPTDPKWWVVRMPSEKMI